eukprot:scaffold1117_cov379-Prasinococcus_capsulatus_cf.AAC.1
MRGIRRSSGGRSRRRGSSASGCQGGAPRAASVAAPARRVRARGVRGCNRRPAALGWMDGRGLADARMDARAKADGSPACEGPHSERERCGGVSRPPGMRGRGGGGACARE